eukprot:6081531-Prorocentrum_lima.AAC.1
MGRIGDLYSDDSNAPAVSCDSAVAPATPQSVRCDNAIAKRASALAGLAAAPGMPSLGHPPLQPL